MIGHLIVVSIGSVLSFVLQCGVGFFLVFPGTMLRDKQNIKMISNLLFYIFLPCMLFVKVAKSVDTDMISRLWAVPVVSITYLLIAFVLGHVLVFLQLLVRLIVVLIRHRGLPADRSFKTEILNLFNVFKRDIKQRVFIMSLTFQNSGTLPFIFVDAVVAQAFMHRAGSREAAVAYNSMFFFPTQVTMWSFCYRYMHLNAQQREKQAATELEEATQGAEKPENILSEMNAIEQEMMESSTQHQEDEIISDMNLDENLEKELVDDQKSTISEGALSGMPPAGDFAPASKAASPMAEVESKKSQFAQHRIVRFVKSFAFMIYQAVMNPPVLGLLCGFLIACISPLKRYLVVEPLPIISSFVYVATMLGDAQFPNSNIVMGANIAFSLLQDLLMQLERDKKEKRQAPMTLRDKAKRALGFLRTFKVAKYNTLDSIILSIVGKQVLIPSIAIGLVTGLTKAGILPSVDPLVHIVLLVQAASPSAMNLSVMCTLSNNGQAQTTSELLLWHYLASPITLLVWSVLFLNLTCTQLSSCD